MIDALTCDRCLRTFNGVANFNREFLHIKVGISINASLVSIFERLRGIHGSLPQ